MRSRLVLAAVPLALVGVTVAPSLAAPKAKPKPITMTYTATAAPGAVCDGTVPTALHKTAFKVPAAGALKVTLSGFTADWDLALTSGGRELASSAGLNPVDGDTEQVVAKFKRASTVSIDACNFVGSPTATVTYVFTYA